MPLTERNREQKLEDYNARLDDLYDLIEEINKSIKNVDKKIAGINNSAKSIEYIMDILNKFETLFNKMTEVEKRKIITFLISAIYVNPEKNMIDSIDFKMDLNNINNTDESIAFNMKIDDENNVAAVNFREKIYERTKEFLPDYVKSKPKNKVVKPKVTY